MKNKRKIVVTIVLVFVIGIVLTIGINLYMIFSTKERITDLSMDYNGIDAIIVLGCKVEGDIPSLMLKKRLDKTIDVYNKIKSKVIISGNGIGDNYDEVSVMNNYLKSDIDNKDIILDKEGLSTYDSLNRAKNVYGVKKVVIVTQKYHMYRALYIADRFGLDAYGVVADDIPQKLIMLKNIIREVLSRDKNFFKTLIIQNKYYINNVLKDVIK